MARAIDIATLADLVVVASDLSEVLSVEGDGEVVEDCRMPIPFETATAVDSRSTRVPRDAIAVSDPSGNSSDISRSILTNRSCSMRSTHSNIKKCGDLPVLENHENQGEFCIRFHCGDETEYI